VLIPLSPCTRPSYFVRPRGQLPDTHSHLSDVICRFWFVFFWHRSVASRFVAALAKGGYLNMTLGSAFKKELGLGTNSTLEPKRTHTHTRLGNARFGCTFRLMGRVAGRRHNMSSPRPGLLASDMWFASLPPGLVPSKSQCI